MTSTTTNNYQQQLQLSKILLTTTKITTTETTTTTIPLPLAVIIFSIRCTRKNSAGEKAFFPSQTICLHDRKRAHFNRRRHLSLSRRQQQQQQRRWHVHVLDRRRVSGTDAEPDLAGEVPGRNRDARARRPKGESTKEGGKAAKRRRKESQEKGETDEEERRRRRRCHYRTNRYE